MTDTDEKYEIRKGGKYTVHGRTEEFTGIFKGYTSLGSGSAMVLDSDGTIRYIPVDRIQYITLIEESKDVKEEKKKTDPGVNYG